MKIFFFTTIYSHIFLQRNVKIFSSSQKRWTKKKISNNSNIFAMKSIVFRTALNFRRFQSGAFCLNCRHSGACHNEIRTIGLCATVKALCVCQIPVKVCKQTKCTLDRYIEDLFDWTWNGFVVVRNQCHIFVRENQFIIRCLVPNYFTNFENLSI